MSPSAQRIAIAEACGWVSIHLPKDEWRPMRGYYQGKLGVVPDFTSDLNAMHEAEKPILAGGPGGPNRELRRKWRFELWQVVSRYAPDLDEEDMIHASAAERAEAFLRALGKWQEA